MSNHFDVIVVGAGIVGSWTAYHLANTGKRILLLEQFPLPHTRGSSHASTRTFKMTGHSDLNLIKDAYKMWQQLQTASASEFGTLMHKTGRLTFSYDSATFLEQWSDEMNKHNIPHELLNSSQIHERFPEIHYPSHKAIYEPHGSVLMAHKCLCAVQQQYKKIGGAMLDGVKVVEIQPDVNQVTITCQQQQPISPTTTTSNSFTCTSLVLTTGAWTSKLIPELKHQLRALATAHIFWRCLKAGAYSAANGFPVISQTPERGCYGVPALEYQGYMKIGTMHGIECDPDQRDLHDDLSSIIDPVSVYVREHYPLLDHTKPAIVEKCLFTYTPDSEPVLDRHPTYPNIIIGAGFSAEGFMSSPATGKLLAKLAGAESLDSLNYKTEKYLLGRFGKNKGKL